MQGKKKDYRVILTAMFLGTCVPAKEEMHFVQATSKEKGKEGVETLVKKKNKWDGKFQWAAKQIVTSNGRLIYPEKNRR